MATLCAPNPFVHSNEVNALDSEERAQIVVQDQSDRRGNESAVFASPKSQPPRDPTSPVVFVSDSYVAEALPEDGPDSPEREYFMRCIVIGENNTGKHSILSANFGEEYHQIPEKPATDLLMKTKKVFKTTKKYHFWVQTLGAHNSAAKQAIWKTYYKCANAFIFVYDTTNKETFDALEKAVIEVQKVVPKDKFFGILVGTKSDMHVHRQVDFEDAMDFKKKYNFGHFIQTCTEVEEENAQILPRLDAKLKKTFEEI